MRAPDSTDNHRGREKGGKNPFQRLSRGARREQGSLLDFDKSAPGTPRAGGSTTSSNSRPSQLDTNHLIQSAAKSILDESSPGSTNDGSEIHGGFHRHQSPKHNGASKLSSLETKPYYNSTMQEDEQDRKRFIGCLAAVLASSYEYDVLDEVDDMNEALRLESSVLLDTGDDSNTEEDFAVNNVISGSFEYSDIDGDVEDRPLVHPQQQQQPVGSSSSSSRTQPKRPPTTSSQHMASSERVSREIQKLRLSRSRHRKRRYDVLSQFLMDCGTYLKLEKGQVKAFLPMLSKVLVPQPAPKESTSASTRRNRAMRWASAANRRSSLESNDGSAPPSSAQSDVSQDSTSQKINMLSQIQGTQVDEFSMRAQDIYNGEVDSIEHLRPFLDSMSPGGGFRCLAIVMLEHLLHSSDGYDARVRHALKRLGVLILVHEMESDPGQVEANLLPSFPGESIGNHDLVALATRRFESLEHTVAKKIIELSKLNQEIVKKGNKSKNSGQGRNSNEDYSPAKGSITRDQVIRGLKVGAVGAAAATVFALTGGLAAPGIAAAAAAVAGGTAVTAAAAAMLTSTAAVTMIFGVGGGTLVAYKMNRRTQGVTEFEFRKESATDEHDSDSAGGGENLEAELFSTITISGWLRDLCDYQRPWGVSPSNPWISDRVELLQRFYAIYRPENIPKCEQILENWEGEEKDLWALLKQKYGRDPDSLFPFEEGPRKDGSLTLDQSELIDRLVIEMGYAPDPTKEKGMNRLKGAWRRRQARYTDEPTQPKSSAQKGGSRNTTQQPVDLLSGENTSGVGSNAGASTISSIGFESISTTVVADTTNTSEEAPSPEQIPAHIATVWDYSATYGGEHYTVRWESELLTELCDSVADLAFDLVSGGTTQILRHTALSALFSAVAWPYALVNAANMIDGTWTLAVERADEAGRELAKSLLFSNAGHRPVTLVGFSFGARVIYACLKELAKYQEIWCDYQEMMAAEADTQRGKERKETRGGDDSLANMREPAAIVEDAIMMGLPNHLSLASWRACRQVVAGRLINCFSQKDLILSLMFQVKRLKLKAVCGACPIAVSGVENFDVSELIPGHEKYTTQAGEVLKTVRHGQPFRSRPTHEFEIDQTGLEPLSSDKFDV